VSPSSRRPKRASRSKYAAPRTRRLLPEPLEPRHLLTGTASISGLVWNDADGDGTRGASEPASSGITVYLLC